MNDPLGFFLLSGFALLIGAVYIAPTLVAFGRGVPERWQILAVNFFLGSTVFGWVFALVWALRPRDRRNWHG